MSQYQPVPEISGCWLIPHFYMEDTRGNFLKFFQRSKMPAPLADLNFHEIFITASRKNVIRGMHFQNPPWDLHKLTTAVQGTVLDVIFDMRRHSPTFQQCFAIQLGENCPFRSIYIPSGCAHGFLTLSEQALMCYHTTCEYKPDFDTGIRYDSSPFSWPVDPGDVIISDKDTALPPWSPERSEFV